MIACLCVCLLVCSSASISPKLHVRSSPNVDACFVWPWLADSSGGVAIRRALPVLWMTSCLRVSAGKGEMRKTYTRSDSTRGSTNRKRRVRHLRFSGLFSATKFDKIHETLSHFNLRHKITRRSCLYIRRCTVARLQCFMYVQLLNFIALWYTSQ